MNTDLEPIASVSTGGNGWSFFLGVLCGAAVGASLALLYAPKRGQELRQQVARQAQSVGRQASAAYGQTAQVVGDVVDRGRRAWQAGREAFRSAAPDNTFAEGGI
jgi:gas vesicle protein